MWLIFAFLFALFAGLTAILVKIGVTGISSNLATATRTIVVLVMAWLVIFLSGKPDFAQLSKRNLLFLALSDLVTRSGLESYPVDNLSVVIGIVLAFVVLRERVTLTDCGGRYDDCV